MLESPNPETTPLPQSVEELSSTKLVPDAKKTGHCCLMGERGGCAEGVPMGMWIVTNHLFLPVLLINVILGNISFLWLDR